MVRLVELNVDNWMAACKLSVTAEQKKVFPIAKDITVSLLTELYGKY